MKMQNVNFYKAINSGNLDRMLFKQEVT